MGRRPIRVLGFGGSFFVVILLGVYVAGGSSNSSNLKAKVAQPSVKTESEELGKDYFQQVLTMDHLVTGPEEVRVATGEADLSIELTFDSRLQRYLMKKLERHKVDWGGVAVIEPTTGGVLALASHSQKEPELRDLALRSTFPAASIFKMVSASAAMERGVFLPNSNVRFPGDMYSIRAREVLRDGGRNHLSLDRAFAKSANAVFGKIGAHPRIGGEVLMDYASRFGFNEEIPFGLAMAPSEAEMNLESRYEAARVAAGFGSVHLSPLHGALLAGSVVNDGKLMEPFLVRRVVDQSGKLRYAYSPRVWKNAVSAVTARKLRGMMSKTITEGTSRRWFRNVGHSKTLKNIRIGGKTGSLTGLNPKGRTEWFVGYAQDDHNRKLALAIVFVSKEYWRIKPSEFARDVFAEYFSPAPVMQASAGQHETYGP